MAIYTGVADANGDFTVPFSSNYIGGQKVTVTAEKDAATKSIELFAPSEVTGGGVIQFSGTLDNFPLNIGVIALSQEISGTIEQYAFASGGSSASNNSIFRRSTGLVINGDVTTISAYAFANWSDAESLLLPSSLLEVGNSAFSSWSKLNEITIPDLVTTIGSQSFTGAVLCKKLTLGSGLASIGSNAFSAMSACDEIISLALTPPTITGTTFGSLKAGCVFKVPAASVAAYQAAPNWSAFAARIQAI